MASLSTWFISRYLTAFLFYAGYHSLSVPPLLCGLSGNRGSFFQKRFGEIRKLTTYETQQKLCTDWSSLYNHVF